MAWIEDRWWITEDAADGKPVKRESSRHGQGCRYRVRYETADGTERARSFEKKGDADVFRDEVAADLRRGTYRDPDAGKISLRKFAEEWLKNQTFDDATRAIVTGRLAHILAGLGARRLDQLAESPSAVQAWIKGLKLAPSTAGQCFGTLSSICNAAVEDGKMAKNPCHARSIRLPKPDERKIEPLEGGQLDALRDALQPRYRATIEAGSSCGLRQGEIFGLSPDDIKFLHHVVQVRRQVKMVAGRLVFALPKRGKTRDVPLPDGVPFTEQLAAFPAVPVTLPWHEPGTRRHGKPVTVSLMFTMPQAHSALTRQRFNTNHWKPALRKAGIPESRENGMHILRHTYASMLLANGTDIKRVAACLGHTDAGFTLRIYAHLMKGGEEQVRRAINSARAVPTPDSERFGNG
jgi:integrase